MLSALYYSSIEFIITLDYNRTSHIFTLLSMLCMTMLKKISPISYIFYFTLAWRVTISGANWWLLDVHPADQSEEISNSRSAKDYCDSLRFLNDIQADFCVKHPTLMHHISNGVKSGIRECQYQFRHSRWNCSTYSASPRQHPFKPIVKFSTRQAAYIHSIISASVTYEVTKACSRGELPEECGCAKIKNLRTSRTTIFWGGCSDDISFGEAVSRQFFDGKLSNTTNLSLKNHIKLHNSEAGRIAVRSKERLDCKCYGITTACGLKSCWKTLPPLRTVGNFLKEKYDSAILVKQKKRKMKLKPRLTSYMLTPNDLVYSRRSKTNFCNKNLSLGSYGTQDRICNATSPGSDGCELMCCGRSTHTRQVMRQRHACHCILPVCPQLCSEIVSESRCL